MLGQTHSSAWATSAQRQQFTNSRNRTLNLRFRRLKCHQAGFGPVRLRIKGQTQRDRSPRKRGHYKGPTWGPSSGSWRSRPPVQLCPRERCGAGLSCKKRLGLNKSYPVEILACGFRCASLLRSVAPSVRRLQARYCSFFCPVLAVAKQLFLQAEMPIRGAEFLTYTIHSYWCCFLAGNSSRR